MIKNQRRTIMGALDYSLESLKNVKSALVDLGNPNHDVNWAVGSIISALTAHLLHITQNVILESMQTGEGNSKNNLLQIQKEFNYGI
jgi:hypothetical protein